LIIEVQIFKVHNNYKKLYNFELVYIALCSHYTGTYLSLLLQFHLVTQEALKTGSGICALCFTWSEIYSRQYEIQVVLDAELVTDVAMLMQSFSSKTSLLISLLCLFAIDLIQELHWPGSCGDVWGNCLNFSHPIPSLLIHFNLGRATSVMR